jgi:hypothetical protein
MPAWNYAERLLLFPARAFRAFEHGNPVGFQIDRASAERRYLAPAFELKLSFSNNTKNSFSCLSFQPDEGDKS